MGERNKDRRRWKRKEDKVEREKRRKGGEMKGKTGRKNGQVWRKRMEGEQEIID